MSTSALTIRSRPEEIKTIGEAGYRLHLTDPELELVAALVCQCRLGQKTSYSMAAYTLITKIEEAMGSDEMHDACEMVDVQVTIEDAAGNIVMTTDDDHFATLEV